jgi:hypothetical protein
MAESEEKPPTYISYHYSKTANRAVPASYDELQQLAEEFTE